MDIWTKEKRSEVMSKIRSKNTKPELLLRSRLFHEGFRFRVHKSDLPGKPDIVLTKFKTIILVNGCFWHNHKKCLDGKIPKSNIKFWKAKIQRNIENDKSNIEKLEQRGWNVLVVWECEIEKRLDETVLALIEKIRTNVNMIK
jgi:DNA mismatch endonuclease (patch repair protein)